MTAILTSVRWYLIVVFIYISLISKAAEQLLKFFSYRYFFFPLVFHGDGFSSIYDLKLQWCDWFDLKMYLTLQGEE